MAFSAHKDPEQVKEHFCDEATLDRQAEEIANVIRNAKHFIVFTGAGVSTSAGIPDFRGPQGVWTMRAKGQMAQAKTSTIKAFPTPSHMSLVSLEKRGMLKFLISQNTDGLHRRSGFPIDKLAELHGNSNLEFCKKCKREYFRDFKARSGGLDVHDHKTGRKCVCGGNLYDTIINFHEDLPEKPLHDGFANARRADVCLVLGSSLTVTPAADMPRECSEEGGKLIICNLQKTPLDDIADIRVFAKTDDLMIKIMEKLNIPIESWKLIRHINVEAKFSNDLRVFSLLVAGVESDGAPASILSQIRIKPDEKENKIMLLEKEPFLFNLSPPNFPFKCHFEMYFMGNFNEPPLALEYVCHKENLPNVIKHRLSFDPRSGRWEVSKV